MKAQAAALALLALAGLAACATPPLYAPAARFGEVGYVESRIERDRFRVTYQGGYGVSEAVAMDFALRRAAELAMQEGYEWFIVDGQLFRQTAPAAPAPENAPNLPRPAPRIGGGLGFGAGTGGFGAGASIDLAPRAGARADLLVRMGRGKRPDLPGVYLASEVKARFMPM